jgi:hypothetical protein
MTDAALDFVAIAAALWSGTTLLAMGGRAFALREVDLWAQARGMFFSLVSVVAYILLMDLGVTSKAIMASVAGGLSAGFALAALLGAHEDWEGIAARGVDAYLLPFALASLALVVGSVRANDTLLALGVLGLLAGTSMGAGQFTYWLVAATRSEQRLATAGAGQVPQAAAPVDVPAFGHVAFVCGQGHPATDPSYFFCVVCGSPVTATPLQPERPAPSQAPCTRCGRPSAAGHRFCMSCGSALAPSAVPAPSASACATCRAPVAPGARFCAACGVKVA